MAGEFKKGSIKERIYKKFLDSTLKTIQDSQDAKSYGEYDNFGNYIINKAGEKLLKEMRQDCWNITDAVGEAFEFTSSNSIEDNDNLLYKDKTGEYKYVSLHSLVSYIANAIYLQDIQRHSLNKEEKQQTTTKDTQNKNNIQPTDKHSIMLSGNYLIIDGIKIRTQEADEAIHASKADEAIHASKADEANKAKSANSAHELDADSPTRGEFISKLKDDDAKGFIRFLAGLGFGDGTNKITPEGKAILTEIFSNYIESQKANIKDSLTTKNLDVTGNARFYSLIIDQVKSIGGSLMLTPANGFIVRKIEENEESYKLFFDVDDGIHKITNMWQVGDQALCNTSNFATGENNGLTKRFYWNLVTGVGTKTIDNKQYHYIVISKTDKAENSTTPEIGDNVVMCGSRNSSDLQRQSVQYFAAYDSLDKGLQAPLFAHYIGVNDFSLSKHRYTYIATNGSKFIGDIELGATTKQYINQEISSKRPYIGEDNYWYVWDDATNSYIKSTKATGNDGANGKDGTNGKDGKDGINGKDGKSISIISTFVDYAIGSNPTTAPTTGWNKNIPEASITTPYVWTRTIVTYSDGKSITSYSVGYYGKDGKDGKNGKDGISISSVKEEYYLSTSNTDITGGSWLTAAPSGVKGKWLWTRNTIYFSNNTTSTTKPICVGYMGTDGSNGANGSPGKNGNDGISITKADVEYSQNQSRTTAPTSGWTTTAPTSKDGYYIWSRTKVTYSNGNTTYTNAVCISGDKGTTGNPGKDGTSVTILSTSITYAVTSSNSQPADSAFTYTSVPAISNGQYLWSKTIVTYSNNVSTKSYSVSRNGINGANGKNGTSVTISSTSITYAVTTANTQPADTAFTYNAIPTIAPGSYLWSKTIVTYSDGNSTKSYTVSRNGTNGVNGKNGVDGKNGTSVSVSSTSITYAISSSSTAVPTSWSNSIVTATDSQPYLWSKTVVTYSDGKSTTTYGISYKGKNGTSVTISSTSVVYAISSSSTTTPTTWSNSIIAATDSQPYLWSKTVVIYSDGKTTTTYGVGYKGKNGKDGTNGKDGKNGVNGKDGSNGVDAEFDKIILTECYAKVNSDDQLGIKINGKINHYKGNKIIVPTNYNNYSLYLCDSATSFNISKGYKITIKNDGSFLYQDDKHITNFSNAGASYGKYMLVLVTNNAIQDQFPFSATLEASATFKIKQATNENIAKIESRVSNNEGDISNIKESAKEINLSVKNINNSLETTGVNIKDKQIELNAENTTINGNLKIKKSDAGLTIYDDDDNPRIQISKTEIDTSNSGTITAAIQAHTYDNCIKFAIDPSGKELPSYDKSYTYDETHKKGSSSGILKSTFNLDGGIKYKTYQQFKISQHTITFRLIKPDALIANGTCKGATVRYYTDDGTTLATAGTTNVEILINTVVFTLTDISFSNTSHSGKINVDVTINQLNITELEACNEQRVIYELNFDCISSGLFRTYNSSGVKNSIIRIGTNGMQITLSERRQLKVINNEIMVNYDDTMLKFGPQGISKWVEYPTSSGGKSNKFVPLNYMRKILYVTSSDKKVKLSTDYDTVVMYGSGDVGFNVPPECAIDGYCFRVYDKSDYGWITFEKYSCMGSRENCHGRHFQTGIGYELENTICREFMFLGKYNTWVECELGVC